MVKAVEVLMAIVKDEDCIRRKDGSYACWDREQEKLIFMQKREGSFEELSLEETRELMIIVGKTR